MISRGAPPTSSDLDRVFTGPNAFSACPESERGALRAILDSHLQQLTVRTLHATGLKVANESSQSGSLYCVLKGRVSLEWKNPAGRSFTFYAYEEGDLFGESGSGFLDLVPFDLGLEACAVPSRTTQTANILELPGFIVARLIKNAHFERGLARHAVLHNWGAAARGSLRHDPRLAVAYCCISPKCGTHIELHPTLLYLGERIAIKKTVTFDELSRLAGLALNAVRPALHALTKLGYIDAVTERSTLITVLQAEALLEAVTIRSFT